MQAERIPYASFSSIETVGRMSDLHVNIVEESHDKDVLQWRWTLVDSSQTRLMSIERFRGEGGSAPFFVASWRRENLASRCAEAARLVQIIHERMAERSGILHPESLFYDVSLASGKKEREESQHWGHGALDGFAEKLRFSSPVEFLRITGPFFSLTISNGRSSLLRLKDSQSAVAVSSRYRIPNVVLAIFAESDDGFPLKNDTCDFLGDVHSGDPLASRVQESIGGFPPVKEFKEIRDTAD